MNPTLLVQEEWKSIPLWEGLYSVSTLFRIRSEDRLLVYEDGRRRMLHGRILKANPNTDGYLCVEMSLNGTRHTIAVHRAYALAFIPNPEGLPEVNHKDGNKRNNTRDNLEWTSHQGNMQHAWSNNLIDQAKGPAIGQSKLKEKDIPVIRRRIAGGEQNKEIAKDYGVTDVAISCIRRNLTWRHC